MKNVNEPSMFNYPSLPRCGVLFNKGALWVGAHYSPFNRRWCINFIPCVTFWVILDGGKTPARAKL